MGKLISMFLILVSCSSKIDSTKLVDRYKQVVVGDKFLIITTEKQWFNSNLFLLNKEREIIQKSNLPFEDKAFVELEKDNKLNLYYFVKDQKERDIIKRTIEVSPVYLNDQIKVNVFFLEDYIGWRELDVLNFVDFNIGLSEMYLSNGDEDMKVPLNEIIRQNSRFYRVVFNDGYLNYFPIQNYEDIHNHLHDLIVGPNDG